MNFFSAHSLRLDGRRCTPDTGLTRGKCVVGSGKRRKNSMLFLPKGRLRREGKVSEEISTLLQGRDAAGELDGQGTEYNFYDRFTV
jgi:hypothetical protein